MSSATVVLSDKLCAIHGEIARSKPRSTAKKIIEEAQYSVIFGHIHSIEMEARLIQVGQGQQVPIMAVSPGCLCRLGGPVPRAKKKMNWQHGFAIAEYDAEGFHHNINVFPIHDGTCLYNGRWITARDHVGQIRKDTDWPQLARAA